MPLKLHRCPATWAKMSGHPCWRVQKALDDMGVEYHLVKEPWLRRSKRTTVIDGTGQSALPAIELEDGTCTASSRGRWRRRSAGGASAPVTPPDRRYTSSLAGL